MEDNEIIELYLRRDERAVSETSAKYGGYCRTISYNILHDSRDADECVNDAYLKAWSSIPPQVPRVFSAYIGRIVRNISLSLYRKKNALKRSGVDVIFDELCELGADIPEDRMETEQRRREIADALNAFLGELNARQRKLFVLRYWYACDIREAARRCGITENNAGVSLSRSRKKLAVILKKRGIKP